VALGVRLVGIGWSLPNAERHYSYHPDEWLVLLASYFVINPYAGEFLPGFYNYGTLPMYLWSLWLHWLSAVGVIDRLPENATPAQIAELRAQLYLWARMLVALMGAGTAVVVGRTVAQVAGIGAGVVSALAMALAPAFVVHSRFMTVDVPTTFFVALAFHQAVALHASPRPMRTLLWGAFWAGCAAGSKYNAGLALLALLVGLWLLPSLPAPKRLLGSAAAVGVAGLTFLIVCPGVWADSARFWANFWYEVRHVGQGHGEIFTDTGLGWLYHLKPNLSTGFGALGLLASAVGWALHARNRVWWGVLAASLAYYLLIGAAEVRFLRYTFPLFPMLAMGVGLSLPPSLRFPPLREGNRTRGQAPPRREGNRTQGRELGSPCSQGEPKGGGLLPALTRLLVIAALAWQLLSAASLTACMVRPDARDQAAQWARANLPEGARIGFPTVPWFYTPPLFAEIGELRWQDRLAAAQRATRYRLIPLAPPEWNAEALQANLPEYLIISEFESRDVARIGRADYQAFMRIVEARYTLLRTFENEPVLLGRREDMPHDLLYICPKIYIYRLREN
jgi:4-amino-4-deoxy-L-arabinose transferase and related glycosyltransferases of PMT family